MEISPFGFALMRPFHFLKSKGVHPCHANHKISGKNSVSSPACHEVVPGKLAAEIQIPLLCGSCCLSKPGTLPETNSSPMKISDPKGKG